MPATFSSSSEQPAPCAPRPGSPFTAPFEELRGGERFLSRGRTITEADVVHFAALTGDRHPQHTDAAWASESRFGARIAHGLLVMSYALGLVALSPEHVVALRRVADAVFKRPVYLGDTIHVDGQVESVRAVDDTHGLVLARWRVVNQRNEVVALARIELLMRRGLPAPPPAPTGSSPATSAARPAGSS
ncbi:MAG: MaoC/PaaZ C-terminal domain-containing protein [Solirubrobacteraceae bacterium]